MQVEATPHEAPGLNGREKKEEEGGITGVTLRPLGVDLRSGPGAELDPPPTTPTLLLRNGNESDGSVRPSATTTRLLPVVKKKSRDAATMATWE